MVISGDGQKIRALSYNIHKGFSTGNLDFVLERMKRSIENAQADIVFLQEVVGWHSEYSAKIESWPTVSQFEYIADRLWPHYAYGKNAVYSSGHHGNAILSKFPIGFYENQDISSNNFEQRGILHATLDIGQRLHVLCVHLSLFEMHRREQIDSLCERITTMVPKGDALLLGGDFNDWRERASGILKQRLQLEEVFLNNTGNHARTFPSWLPALKLDRIYYRGLSCESVNLLSGGEWSRLSDHLPILAEFCL